jgi:hypothetical protein
MTTSTDKAPREIAIPGQPELLLHIHGADKAEDRWDAMGQGFYISRAGVPTPRAELTELEREAVRVYMEDNHPEHALL